MTSKLLVNNVKALFTLLKNSPEIFFSVCAFIFGITFLFIVPPLQTPDEATHFLRAYQISEGGFLSENVAGKTGGYLPSSIQSTFNTLEQGGPIQFNGNKKYSHRQTKSALVDIPLRQGDRQFYDISSAATYSPIAYIPQVIGVIIGKVLDLPVIVMLYVVRLFNLLFWIGIIYGAIKLFPWKKWAVVGISLLPMVVAQSVSAGIDVMSVGSGILFSAGIFYLISSKHVVTVKIAAALVILAVAMILSKQVMIALLPLVFLIKKEQFLVKKYSYLFMAIMIFVPLLFLAIWTLLSPEISQSAAQIQNNQNTGGQLKYIVANPWEFFTVLYHTFFFTWGDGVWLSLMGNFGWVDTPLASMFVISGYIALAFYLGANYEKIEILKKITKTARWTLAVIALGYTLLVCLAMYILYSPLKYEIIIGIQGRYFFPVLFLLIPLSFTNAIRVRKRFFSNFVMLFSLVILSVSTITIVYRYYLTYL